MPDLIIAASRFLFIAVMFIFVMCVYRDFSKSTAQHSDRYINISTACIIIFHLAAYLILYMQLKNNEIIIMYVLELLFIIIYMYAYHVLYPYSSKTLLNNICFCMVIGFVMITRLNIDKGQRQFVYVFAGGVASLIIPYLMTKLRGLRRFSWLYGIAGIAALALVYLIGATENGANLSLSIAGISIQPAEFVKIVFVFFIASMLREDTSFKNILITTVLAAIHVIILVLSTDLGSALIFFCTYIIMLFSATGNPLYAGLGIGCGAGASYIAYMLFEHIKIRVRVWLDPWSLIDGKGYQTTQSLFAIGTGSWLGSGLFKGMPQKIPYVEKDFMFSAVAEEFGVVFSVGMILVLLNMALLIMKAGMKLKDNFYRLLATGFASAYIVQIFLTIGGGLNMIPITGVTLPLISYGGSSAVSTLMMLAVVQGLNLIDEVDAGVKKGKK